MSNCEKTLENLSAYIDGFLDKVDAEEVKLHLESCNSCRLELQELLHVIGLIKETGQADLPADFSKNLHEKLLNINSAGAKKRSFFSRHAKTLSTLAAGLLIVFVVRDYIGISLRMESQMKGASDRIGSTTSADAQTHDANMVEPNAQMAVKSPESEPKESADEVEGRQNAASGSADMDTLSGAMPEAGINTRAAFDDNTTPVNTPEASTKIQMDTNQKAVRAIEEETAETYAAAPSAAGAGEAAPNTEAYSGAEYPTAEAPTYAEQEREAPQKTDVPLEAKSDSGEDALKDMEESRPSQSWKEADGEKINEAMGEGSFNIMGKDAGSGAAEGGLPRASSSHEAVVPDDIGSMGNINQVTVYAKDTEIALDMAQAYMKAHNKDFEVLGIFKYDVSPVSVNEEHMTVMKLKINHTVLPELLEYLKSTFRSENVVMGNQGIAIRNEEIQLNLIIRGTK